MSDRSPVKRRRMLALSVAALGALALPVGVTSSQTAGTTLQAAPPQGQPLRGLGQSYDVTSKITGRTYRLFVYVPGGPPPPGGFPVIYVLDGNWYFGMTVDTAILQAATGELPPAVIVGVGYPIDDRGKAVNERFVDMSLPIKPSAMPPQFQSLPVKPGGLDGFLRFLQQEAKSLVERLAPIDRRCQTLFGHSLGGLAVLRELFTNPTDYQSYIAASPAIFWDDRAVLADEAAFTARALSGDIHARLLLTVGGLEQTPTAALLQKNPRIGEQFARTRMVDNMRDLGTRLSAKPAPYFKVAAEVVAGERHNSVLPTVLNRALHFGLPCDAGG